MQRHASGWACTAVALALLAQGCSSGSSPDSALEPSRGSDTPSISQLSAALDLEFKRLGVDPEKKAAAAPKGSANAVFDLSATVIDADGEGGDPATGLHLMWTERLIGDYDSNGQVLASDLSALGLNFSRSVSYAPAAEHNGIRAMPLGDRLDCGGVLETERPPLDSGAGNWRLARVDGDGNGTIGISDLTPIGVHFKERIDGYRIYRKGPDDGDFVLLPNPNDPQSAFTIGRAEVAGSSDNGRPVIYGFDDLLSVEGDYQYAVAPYDSASGTEGPRSVVGFDGEGNPSGESFACGFSFGPPPNTDPPLFSGVLVIRNDGDAYPTNYDALTGDLDALPVQYDEIDYFDGVDDYFINGDYNLAIWYRGGPSASEPGETSQTTAWTDTEIENYLNILNADGDTLMLSQNNGIDDFTFFGGPGMGNAWDSLPGFSSVAPVATFYQRELGWASGIGTDDGIGYGGTYGYLHCAPSSAIGTFTTRSQLDTSGGGERYAGASSSGHVPLGIGFSEDTQFCSIGWYSPIFSFTGIACSGFSAGQGFDPYEGQDFDWSEGHYPDTKIAFAYVSYGNTTAPVTDMGGFMDPYDQSNAGTAHLWVVGYSWNDVQVTPSNGDSMDRKDLLHNILGWLHD